MTRGYPRDKILPEENLSAYGIEGKMTKNELVKKIAMDANITQSQADAALSALINTIIIEIQSGNDLMIHGLGKISVIDRAARQGRNPQTGEQITIPAKRVPKITFSKQIKDATNQR